MISRILKFVVGNTLCFGNRKRLAYYSDITSTGSCQMRYGRYNGTGYMYTTTSLTISANFNIKAAIVSSDRITRSGDGYNIGTTAIIISGYNTSFSYVPDRTPVLITCGRISGNNLYVSSALNHSDYTYHYVLFG